jgi:hypothetical protein
VSYNKTLSTVSDSSPLADVLATVGRCAIGPLTLGARQLGLFQTDVHLRVVEVEVPDGGAPLRLLTVGPPETKFLATSENVGGLVRSAELCPLGQPGQPPVGVLAGVAVSALGDCRAP